jgi:dipeptidyl aminopeptidase/acylaminoacyl peptidase
MTVLQEMQVDNESIYWVETRPAEAGRAVLVRADAHGCLSDVTPQGYSVRSLVNAYGGGAFAVARDRVVFSNFARACAEEAFASSMDQRLFLQIAGQQPVPLTTRPGKFYADGVFDHARGRLITVCEDQEQCLHGQPASSLVSVSLDGSGLEETLVQGNDFYASPRLSPDGRQLCWLTWNYPQMPWDGTELWLADLDEHGTICQPRLIAGGEHESIVQPAWSPDGRLHFVSDRTDWWNLYRFVAGQVEAICPGSAEFATPPWVMGISLYDFLPDNCIVCAYIQNGTVHLALVQGENGILQELETGYTYISAVRAGRTFFAFFGSSPTQPLALVKHDLTSGQQTILRSSLKLDLQDLLPFLSRPRSISYPTTNAATAHAFYYPPTNPDYAPLPDELPPLLVVSHGGPTAASHSGFNLLIQYFTSRGFAVVDVNYRGSSGYGRAYRQALHSNWGVYDWEDCASAARYLSESGEVDGQRVVSRGGSSGGYTVLCLLAFTDLLRAGASYYGISNLELLAAHTDKLEAHYLDQMVAPPAQGKALYEARSPACHADQITAPTIFFHGLEDPIVPPEQTRTIVAELEQRGIPVAALYYPAESHGFRLAENIQHALEAELSFYGQVLGFQPAGVSSEIGIKNWP